MKGDLLWVYEGLTNYLGIVLSARSGLATLEDAKQEIAGDIGQVSSPGRRWRPLGDTATSVQLLNLAGSNGNSLRRRARLLPGGHAHLARGGRPHPHEDERAEVAR